MTDGNRSLAELHDIQETLTAAGYRSAIVTLGRFPRVLLAENPYALVAVFELEGWDGATEGVADVQAELTRIATGASQSAIRWDLYVVLHVRHPGLQAIPSEVVEIIESDTKYTRKFVRVNLSRDPLRLDRALRPLLPLRPRLSLEAVDPLVLLKHELVNQGLSDELAASSVESFARSGSVVLP